jgi:hypothetical protein
MRIIFLLCYHELCTLQQEFCWDTVDELILENVFELLILPQVAGVGFVALIEDLMCTSREPRVGRTQTTRTSGRIYGRKHP